MIELQLRQALRGRRLVCELVIDPDAREPARRALESVLEVAHYHDYRRVQRLYPATLVTVVTTEAVFKYHAGDLWSHLSLPGTGTEIGQAFAGAIRELGLEEFAVFDDQGAHRYVSRILAHGGVPVYCLEDLFRLVEHARARGISEAGEALELLAEETRWRVSIDRPVQRFLRDTGRVGRDFLQRVLELLEESEVADTDREVADRLGVPLHVVQAYRQRDPATASSLSKGMRVARPRLFFDPDITDCPELILAGGSGGVATWRVLHEHGAEVPPLITATNREDDRVPLAPAARWRALAEDADGAVVRGFSISGVSADRPALVFDVETGEPPADPRFSPGREVWVLAPCRLEPAVAGSLEVLRTIPMQAGDWGGWFAHDVLITATGDLTGLHRLERITVRLGVEPLVQVAFTNLVSGVTTTDARIVFSDPPALSRVPWTADDAHLWQVTLARGKRDHRTILLDADPAVTSTRISEAVGSGMVPDLTLRMLGPVGNGVKLTAAVVPGLRLALPASPIFPAQAVEVAVSAREGITLLHEGELCSHVTVTSDMSRAVVLASAQGCGEVELTFRCPVVRWRFIDKSGSATPTASSVIRHIVASGAPSAGVLELDAASGAAHVRITAGSGATGPVELPLVRRKAGVSRFDLAPAFAALLEGSAGTISLRAEVDGNWCTVMELGETVTLELRSITYLEDRDGSPGLLYTLEQSKPLAGRCIQVVSLDRPWQRASVIRLDASSSDGRVTCGRLLPGRYEATAGLEAGPGTIRRIGAAPPIRFQLPWPQVGDQAPNMDSMSTPDRLREQLVRALRDPNPAYSMEPPEEPGGTRAAILDRRVAAPAAALLLGSTECDAPAAGRIASAMPLALDEWIQAFDSAAEDYGMSASATIRASLRVLARSAQESSPPREPGIFAGRLLRIAACARTDVITRPIAAMLRTLTGSDTPLPPDAVLGSTARPVTLERLREELSELGRVPTTPLSTNGRVVGMLGVRVAARSDPIGVGRLAMHYSAGASDLTFLPAAVRRMCINARECLRQPGFPDGSRTLLLHVATFEAAAHVAFGTGKLYTASEYLALVARWFPAYVDTRMAYFFALRLADAPR